MLISSLGGVPTTVSRLDGSSAAVELTGISADTILVTTEDGPQEIPRDDLMLLEFPDREVTTPEGVWKATLVDKSTLLATSGKLEGTTVSLQLGENDPLEIPTKLINDLRIASLDPQVSASWEELRNRQPRDDLLIFLKEGVLDYVAGTISAVTSEHVAILVRGRELKAPLERVFGMVFANRTPIKTPPAAILKDTFGQRFAIAKIEFQEEAFDLELLSGAKFKLPVTRTFSIDFASGDLQYLADLPFDETASTAPDENSSVAWFVCKNSPAGSGGKHPLLIGDDYYPRGLWLHSGANVRYLLNREFKELRAVAGFEMYTPQRMPKYDPRVRLVVIADGEERFSQEFSWRDEPVPLNIDLKDVRELIIRVESLGRIKGVLEHFALGDARVLR